MFAISKILDHISNLGVFEGKAMQQPLCNQNVHCKKFALF